jgi:hypothetical protein
LRQWTAKGGSERCEARCKEGAGRQIGGSPKDREEAGLYKNREDVARGEESAIKSEETEEGKEEKRGERREKRERVSPGRSVVWPVLWGYPS